MNSLRQRIVWSRFARDIAVIIVGVLIALAVDGWRSQRADRRLEEQYLARLIRDLKVDSTMLAEQSGLAVRGESAALALVGLLDDKDGAVHDTIVGKLMSDATRGAYLSANTPTIEELTSTGNLRVLRDMALREAILTYYATLPRFQKSIETVMRRGKDPLGELGWDIRAYDQLLPYSVNVGKASRETQSAAVLQSAQRTQVLASFRARADARRVAHRAVTYNAMLQPILSEWEKARQELRGRIK